MMGACVGSLEPLSAGDNPRHRSVNVQNGRMRCSFHLTFFLSITGNKTFGWTSIKEFVPFKGRDRHMGFYRLSDRRVSLDCV